MDNLYNLIAEAKQFPELVSRVILITPELAEKFLERNSHNRPLLRSHVNFLAGEMRESRWQYNSFPIVFSSEGILLDGQHRLEAILLTGMSFPFAVSGRLPPGVFTTIDENRPRSGGDTLALLGERNSRNLAAGIGLAYDILTGRTDFQRTTKISNAKLLTILDEHPEIRKSIPFSRSLNSLIAPSVVIALHYVFGLKHSPGMSDTFFHRVATGESLAVHDPILLLRKRLIENATSKAKISRRYMAALIIKAWNNWAHGKALRSLKFIEAGEAPEPFPEIK